MQFHLLALRPFGRSAFPSVGALAFVAVGLSALSTAFNIADAALWRPPPLHDARALVVVNSTHTNARGVERQARWSYARIQLLRQRARSFGAVSNYTPASLTLMGNEAPELVAGEFVSPEYFRVLAVRAAAGRLFIAADDSGTGAHPIAVISHTFWQQRFNARADIVGQQLRLSGAQVTIVGVAERAFSGITGSAVLWLPTTMAPVVSYPEYLTTDQNFINVLARFRPAVSLAQASAEFKTLGPALFAELPVSNSEERSGAVVWSVNEARTSPATRKAVLILLAAVGLLYLLACTNAINLLLARAAARRRDMAIRQALGATRAQLLPVVVGETALLVAAGGILGLLLAFATNRLIPAPEQLWNSQSRIFALGSFAEPAFGWRSVLFGVALIAFTTVLIAWVPTTVLLRTGTSAGLRDSARGFTVGGATLRRPTASGVIVAVEAALAMVLLLAGSLFIDSFGRMRRTDLGIDAERVLTFDLRVPDALVAPDAAPAFLTRVLTAITAVPGVVSATVDGGAPVSGSASSTLLVVGRPVPADADQPGVLRHYVAPDHFKTLGIPLIAGRAFTSRDDMSHPHVVIISALAARRFWPNENPIGQRVWFGGGSSFNSIERSGEIIGIVGDVAYQPLDRTPFQPDFYTPYTQFTYASRTMFVRTRGNPLAVANAIRAAVRAVSPDTPLRDVQSMNQLIGKSWTRQRFDALLFGGFALLALLLSASGIYAVVSHAMDQRTREMGIRIALGATTGAVLRLVVREGMAFPLAGLAVGLALSLAAGRVIAASLYQLSPSDPVIVARTLAVLLVASATACLLPALRATRVNPLVAMGE